MALINIQYTADISQLNAKLDQIIQKQERVGSTSKKAGDDMSNAAKNASGEVGFLNNNLQKLAGAVTAAFSVQKVLEFTKSVFDAERRVELLQNRLNFLAGSASKGSEAFLRMATTAKALGLDLETTLSGFADFGIAATQAGIAVQQAERIFISVASGLRAAGASSLQTQRAFYALQQMMSKGVVAAEELRRQLGEALPGANELMVRAYNRLHPKQELTNRQFMKMQEEGKIISREILPEFAKVIEETFAPALAGKANSLDASVNRVTGAWLQFKLAVGDTEAFKSATDAVGGTLDVMNIALTDDSLSRLERFMIITSAPRLSSMSEEEMENAVMGIEKVFVKALQRQKQRADLSLSVSRAEEEALGSLSAVYEKFSDTQREAEMKMAVDTIEANREAIKQADDAIKKKEEEVKAAQSLVKVLVESRNPLKRLTEEQEQQLKFAIDTRDVAQAKIDISKEERKQAENTISTLQGAIKQYSLLDQAREEANKPDKKMIEEQRKAQEQLLRDEVALADARLLKTQKGSIEEGVARANLADKQRELNEFMAKSDATMQLERLKGEIKTNEEILRADQKFLEARFNQSVVEEEVDPSKDPALKRIDKELETYAKNSSRITQAIASPYLSAQDLEIASATMKYKELMSLTEENSEERKMLEEALQQELDNIRQRYADKDQGREDTRLRRLSRAMSQTINSFGRLIQAQIQLSIDASKQELAELEKRNKQGLISEEQYEKQKEDIQRRVFENEKSMQVARAVMSGANAILSIIGNPTLAPIAPVLIPITAALTAAQISQIQSQKPGFKDGVIDLQGPGTESSDSIVARLSKGESVMTAKETRKYKDVLEAIREDRLPGLIAEKYLIPAYESSMNREKKPELNKTSMELAFQTAELVQAVRSNKVINLSDKSVSRLASAMNKTKAMDKKIRRRGL